MIDRKPFAFLSYRVSANIACGLGRLLSIIVTRQEIHIVHPSESTSLHGPYKYNPFTLPNLDLGLGLGSLDLLGQLGHRGEQIRYEPVVRDLEDRCVRILFHGRR